MGDQWQLEAIQQQFEVFGNIRTPYTVIAVDNIGALINLIRPVINQHLQLQNTINVALRQICAEIIRNVDENQREIRFSFVVIVLNQEFNRGLAKIPVFTIINGNQRLFIDINCSVYTNWNAFIKSNSLPACEYCHPVDGQYNVGQRLKIDFTKSPAMLSRPRLYSLLTDMVLCVGAVAASFFVTISETTFKCCRELIGIVQHFFPKINFNWFLTLANQVQKIKNGLYSRRDFLSVINLLRSFYDEHKDAIAPFWEEVKDHFKSLCNFIRKKLRRFFASASPTSQHQFLAITQRVDTEISNLEEQAEVRLNAEYEMVRGYSNAGNTAGQFSVPVMGNKNSTIANKQVSDANRYVHDIFKNCQKDITLYRGQKDDKSDMIGRGTQELLDISINVANHLKQENLSDVETTFLSLSSVVRNEYNQKIDVYVKTLKAVKACARNDIDIQALHDSLGIKGNPKEHYWNETIKSIQEHRFSSQIKKNIDEIKKNNKILLIPVSTVHEGSIEGFYRCTGIQGQGKIPASAILNSLKERFSYLNVQDVVINESITEGTYIFMDPYTIMVYQNTYEYNTSEGMVFIMKH